MSIEARPARLDSHDHALRRRLDAGRPWMLAFVALAGVLALAACRQPDGPRPSPDEEQANKTYDVGRDLQAVANAEPDSAQSLFEDLENFTSRPPSSEMVRELTNALDEALRGRQTTPEAAQELAESLFVVMNARQMNDTQIEALRTEVAERVRRAGGDEGKAMEVATIAGRIQTEATSNRRRWYHFF